LDVTTMIAATNATAIIVPQSNAARSVFIGKWRVAHASAAIRLSAFRRAWYHSRA
jgi:hypothetical protein